MAQALFRSQVALVTGAASGIGQATARALGQQGARLAVLDLQQAALEASAAALKAANVEVLPLIADITQYPQVEQAIEQLRARWGRIDMLINCAGILRAGPFDKTPAEVLRAQMDINYMGTVHCIRAALPMMQAQRSGRIINIASVAGLWGLPEFTGYSASKFAVYGFTQSLRDELRPHGISVSVVCPPPVDTPMVRELTYRPAIFDRFPHLSAEQVARAIIKGLRTKQFLIFPDAKSQWLWLGARWWPGLAGRLVSAWSKPRKRGGRGSGVGERINRH